MYKLLFIENPHDAKSREIKEALQQAGIQEETHFLRFDEIQGLPIQAAPCVFLMGIPDLLDNFTSEEVLTQLQFIKGKQQTEDRLNYLGQLAVRARLAGVK